MNKILGFLSLYLMHHFRNANFINSAKLFMVISCELMNKTFARILRPNLFF